MTPDDATRGTPHGSGSQLPGSDSAPWFQSASEELRSTPTPGDRSTTSPPRHREPGPAPRTPKPVRRRRGSSGRSSRHRRGPQKSNGGIIVGGVIAALVVIALVAGIIVIANQSSPHRTTSSAQSPEKVVQALFEAISASDARAALALQEEPAPASELLSDAVLQRSAQIAPISELQTTLISPTQVQATYLLGTEEASATFDVVETPEGDWRLARATTTVQFTPPPNVPLVVNDVDITSDTAEALPGAYAMTTSLPRIAYDSPPFLVKGPDSFPNLEPVPTLTPEGLNDFRDAVQDALEACLERKELAPEGCPQSVAKKDNQEVRPATIAWTLLDDPVPDLDPKLTSGDRTVASARLEFTVRLDAEVSVDGGPSGPVDTTLDVTTDARGSVANDPITVSFVQS